MRAHAASANFTAVAVQRLGDPWLHAQEFDEALVIEQETPQPSGLSGVSDGTRGLLVTPATRRQVRMQSIQ